VLEHQLFQWGKECSNFTTRTLCGARFPAYFSLRKIVRTSQAKIDAPCGFL
jgi:hypothetical protein